MVRAECLTEVGFPRKRTYKFPNGPEFVLQPDTWVKKKTQNALPLIPSVSLKKLGPNRGNISVSSIIQFTHTQIHHSPEGSSLVLQVAKHAPFSTYPNNLS